MPARKSAIRPPLAADAASDNAPVDTAKASTTKSQAVKAADLRPYLGKILEVTWGVGSQQHKQTARGEVREVTDRFVLLSVQKDKAKTPFRLPLSFCIRFSEVFA